MCANIGDLKERFFCSWTQAMKSLKDVKTQFKDLENKFRLSRKDKSYREAQESLQKMIDLVQDHSTMFDEPNDQINILQARKVMVSYRMERLYGGTKTSQFLREAAVYSTPSVCLGQPCHEYDSETCKSRRAQLSPRQQKMCVEKLSNISDALKIEAAIAALRHDHQQALDKRRMAVKIHKTVTEFDKSLWILKGQQYLEYWCFITEGCIALLNSNFSQAKEWFNKAQTKGSNLNHRRCFPNYFRDIQEITSYEFYINGVEKVKSMQFGEARNQFLKWLNLNPKMARKNNLRFDNITIFAMVCDILDRLPKQTVQKAEWEALEKSIDRLYVVNTTWTLWNRLLWLHELSFKLQREQFDYLKLNLQREVNKISNEWNLFIPDASLLGEDRTSGLQRRVSFLSFIDIFDHLDKMKHNWQQILIQNLKNVLMVMADYEFRRYLDPPPKEQNLPGARDRLLRKPSETMSIPVLTQLIIRYLSRRSVKHKRIFENALLYFSHFTSAIENNDFIEAVTAQKDLLEEIRFWPHVIRVINQEPLPRPIFLDEDDPNFLANKTIALRLWNREPKTIEFEGPQDLEKNSYYYLRPRWNMKSPEKYRIRREQFHKSNLPRWINVFFENIFGRGKFNPRKFHDWILQFEDSERILACRLFDALDFYDEEKMRQVWAEAFRKLPPDAKTKTAYIGLGHGAKSGRINPYLFRQGVSELPEYDALFKGKEMKIFRDIAEFEKKELKLQKPKTLVFLDDFIGTGGQAKDFLEWYFSKYSWFHGVSIYLCALVGFRKAIEENVKKPLYRKVKDVIVGNMLDEENRAFSPDNPIWESKEECKNIAQWAKKVGYQLLNSNPVYDSKGNSIYDPDRDALGWHGCQALVTFHHNIPSDTLPTFWATGNRNGKEWKGLQDRYD